MAEFIKIKSINLTKLNNAEYRTFMARFQNLIMNEEEEEETPEVVSMDTNDPLGISEELRLAFNEDFNALTDSVNQTTASEETAPMNTLDKERGDLLVYLTTTISQTRKNPIEAKRLAAERLYIIVKPYVGAANLPRLQETAAIEGLLIDLAKEGMPEAIEELDLTEIIALLKEKNRSYAELTEQRSNAKADSTVESAKKIRLRMDQEYEEMTTYAFATSVLNPTTETSNFISRLNVLIDETKALYNQRIALTKAAADKKKDSESETPDVV